MKRRSKEVLVPLSHAPGRAQVGFGETLGVIDGLECKLDARINPQLAKAMKA